MVQFAFNLQTKCKKIVVASEKAFVICNTEVTKQGSSKMISQSEYTACIELIDKFRIIKTCKRINIGNKK